MRSLWMEQPAVVAAGVVDAWSAGRDPLAFCSLPHGRPNSASGLHPQRRHHRAGKSSQESRNDKVANRKTQRRDPVDTPHSYQSIGLSGVMSGERGERSASFVEAGWWAL